jgi:hypothetical protein
MSHDNVAILAVRNLTRNSWFITNRAIRVMVVPFLVAVGGCAQYYPQTAREMPEGQLATIRPTGVSSANGFTALLWTIRSLDSNAGDECRVTAPLHVAPGKYELNIGWIYSLPTFNNVTYVPTSISAPGLKSWHIGSTRWGVEVSGSTSLQLDAKPGKTYLFNGSASTDGNEVSVTFSFTEYNEK